MERKRLSRPRASLASLSQLEKPRASIKAPTRTLKRHTIPSLKRRHGDILEHGVCISPPKKRFPLSPTSRNIEEIFSPVREVPSPPPHKETPKKEPKPETVKDIKERIAKKEKDVARLELLLLSHEQDTEFYKTLINRMRQAGEGVAHDLVAMLERNENEK